MEIFLIISLSDEKIRQRGKQAVLPTLLPHPKPSAKQMIRAFFGNRKRRRFSHKQAVLPTIRGLEAFVLSVLVLLTSIKNSRSKLKILKHKAATLMTKPGLSDDTTARPI
jgi:hypothetical protein